MAEPESQANALMDSRPSLWPHRPAEGDLSDDIESRLVRAHGCSAHEAPVARRLLQEAIGLARRHGDETVLPRCLYRAASVALQMGNACGAYVMCLEAQPLLERLDDRWRATKVLKLRGRCCLSVGENELAETLLSEAADRFDKMDSALEVARCEGLLSWAYRNEGNLLAAVQLSERALRQVDPSLVGLRQLLGSGLARARLELARRLQAVQDTVAAEEELAAAAAVLPDPDDVLDGSQAAQLLDAIATVCAERRQHPEHRRALTVLLLRARQRRDPAALGLAWLRMSQLRASQGRLQAALNGVRRAIRSLEQAPRSPLLPSAQKLLASLLELSHDRQGAYEAFGLALRNEAEQDRATISERLELLALDSKAAQDLRDTEQTLAYAQRFSNVGYLVASVNHELNQPLASIRLLAETAMELIDRGLIDEVQESLHSMLRLSIRLNDLASKLAQFPVREDTARQRVGIRAAVEEALAMLQSRIAQTPCEINRLCEDVHVWAHEAQLVHVIANLVNNAIDAMAEQPHRRIDFSCAVGAQRVVLTLRDNGPGIPPAAYERLFHPFFSTKAAGQGLGLGLALSRDALRAMGGDLAARNDGDVGATFEISLDGDGSA